MRYSSRRSSYLRGLLLCSAGCILISSSLLAAKKSKHSDVTEVVVIEVPVQVTYGGEPARELTPDQFELFDGRKRRELTGFDVYDLSGSATEETPLGLRIPAVAQRKFLLLFDLSLSMPEAISRAQEAAREMVTVGLEQTDLVGVATWSLWGGLDLVLSFTSDRRQADLAITSLGQADRSDFERDPLGIEYAHMPVHWGQTRGGGTVFPLEPSPLEVIPGRGPPDSLSVRQQQSLGRQDEVKKDLASLSSAITELAHSMRSVDGRKHVVFFSEGFDASVALGQGGGSTFDERLAIEKQNNASAYGMYENVDTNLRFGDTSMQNELGRVLRELVRSDCVIEAVDIGGQRAGEESASKRQGLFWLANGTGGELFENFNNLNEAMHQMLERTSVTYVLAFHAENLKLDGKFHKLQVLLEGRPDGFRVVHRPGYFAPRPYSEVSRQERKLSAASHLFGEPGGELGVATLAAPFEVDSLPAYVPSLIEVDGADLLEGSEGGQVTAEVYAYAIAANGEVRDYYNQILGIDIEKAGTALQQKGLKLWSQFEVPPGEYMARVLVRNAVTGTSGVAVAPFRVPDGSLEEPTLLAPLFPEPAGQWLNVRGQRAEESQHDYPFTVQGQAFEPSVKPVLTVGQSAAVLLAGYGLGDQVEIRGQLLTPAGEPAGRVFLNLGERRMDSDSGLAQWAATLSVSELDPGDYVLLVTATDPESGRSSSSSITVEVPG